MNSLNFEQARQYAVNRLERELFPGLVYHGIAHTREEVVPAVETLSGMEGVQGESLHLLFTATWFHDIGFVRQSMNHELISVQITQDVLPSFGYTQDQIEMISRAILATALPQSPANLMEQILVDADLDVLGRENFMQRNHDLRSELAYLGQEFSDEQWYPEQLKFLEGHKYFTASARLLRDAQKLRNIKQLRRTLELLTPGS